MIHVRVCGQKIVDQYLCAYLIEGGNRMEITLCIDENSLIYLNEEEKIEKIENICKLEGIPYEPGKSIIEIEFRGNEKMLDNLEETSKRIDEIIKFNFGLSEDTLAFMFFVYEGMPYAFFTSSYMLTDIKNLEVEDRNLYENVEILLSNLSKIVGNICKEIEMAMFMKWLKFKTKRQIEKEKYQEDKNKKDWENEEKKKKQRQQEEFYQNAETHSEMFQQQKLKKEEEKRKEEKEIKKNLKKLDRKVRNLDNSQEAEDSLNDTAKFHNCSEEDKIVRKKDQNFNRLLREKNVKMSEEFANLDLDYNSEKVLKELVYEEKENDTGENLESNEDLNSVIREEDIADINEKKESENPCLDPLSR